MRSQETGPDTRCAAFAAPGPWVPETDEYPGHVLRSKSIAPSRQKVNAEAHLEKGRTR
jgi:hypothetical protein